MASRKDKMKISALDESKALTQTEAQQAYDSALTTIGNRCLNPEIAAARERMQADLARKLNISKADVILGMQDAIADARLLADPKAQIGGWREIGLLMGYYEPAVVNVNFSGPLEKVREALSQMDTNKLQELIGEDIIDVAFYPVEKHRVEKVD